MWLSRAATHGPDDVHEAGLTGLPMLLLPVLAGGAAVVRDRRPDAQPWLLVLAASSVVAAVVHLWVAPEHFGESALYGAFFLATAVAGFGYAAWILARPTRRLLLAGTAANTAIVGLWLVTRLVAVPLGPGAGETEPFGALDVLASGAELVALVVCLVALLARLDVGQASRSDSHRRAVGISRFQVSKL